jgi:heterodisulfide reductase subunit A2
MLLDKHVAVIGAGVAGLSAADELARRGIQVTVIEKEAAPGGHAARLNCKALDRCVQCGACLVQERMRRVVRQPRIELMTDTRVVGIKHCQGFEVSYATGEGAQQSSGAFKAHALLLATGFAVYDPGDKPYGYGKFADVVTNLDAERIWRANGRLKRPSDGRAPVRVAFIQCVGSRDARIGHNWCSRICCGSSLRMARMIQKTQPGTAVAFFYIDVQTFGRNFQTFYDQCRQTIQTVRAIPGDIVQNEDGGLQVTCFDPQRAEPVDQTFDMVVLSAGMAPPADNAALSAMTGAPLDETGFLSVPQSAALSGVFVAGAALGPMAIAGSIDSAVRTAGDVVRFLQGASPVAPGLDQAIQGGQGRACE